MTQHSLATALLDPDTPWCEIRLGEQTTRYVRLGMGRPVVLLAGSPAPIWPGAIEALAARNRVYAPEIPGDLSAVGRWLRGFLDGVGAERPTVIATSSLCIPALEYALLEPDRLDRLVLVPDGTAEETGLDGTLGATNGAATLPILVLRREHPPDSAVEVLMSFLRQPVPR